MSKVIISGVGLIGGSIALKIKQQKLFNEVVGIARPGGTNLKPFVNSDMLDRVSMCIEEEIRDADLVILASPVAQIEQTFQVITPHLGSKTLITDVGSTKKNIMLSAKIGLKNKHHQFIGSHPIAGSEKHGPGSAQIDLFLKKNIIVTPFEKTPQKNIKTIKKFWHAIGGKTTVLDAKTHDQIFSTVSHLPHMLAFGLVNQILRDKNKKLMLNFAASGFRDFSRIAASSPEVWRDICIANRSSLITDLKKFQSQIDKMISLIEKNDEKKLLNYLKDASKTRQEWSE